MNMTLKTAASLKVGDVVHLAEEDSPNGCSAIGRVTRTLHRSAVLSEWCFDLEELLPGRPGGTLVVRCSAISEFRVLNA